MDLITVKKKSPCGLKNKCCWRFSELQEEFKCAAVTAPRQKLCTTSRYLFWCIKGDWKEKALKTKKVNHKPRK